MEEGRQLVRSSYRGSSIYLPLTTLLSMLPQTGSDEGQGRKGVVYVLALTPSHRTLWSNPLGLGGGMENWD